MLPGADAGPGAGALASRRPGLGQLVQHLAPWRETGAAHAPGHGACLAGEALGSDWVIVTRQDAAEMAEPDAGGACQGAALAGAACQEPAGSAPRGWERCVDYCNGGPVFCPDRDPGRDPGGAHPSFRVLAEYEDLGGAIAAVRCAVGRGRAVLCGTHPELSPHWLDAACAGQGGPAVPSAGTVGGARTTRAADEGQPGRSGGDTRAAGVRAALARDAPARRRLWRMLLAEAGLVGLRDSSVGWC